MNISNNSNNGKTMCNKCGSTNVKNGVCEACANATGPVGMVRSQVNKSVNWYNGLTAPEKVHLLITMVFVLIGVVSTFTLLRPFNIFGNTISMMSFVVMTFVVVGWYLVFRVIMKELQKRGYNKLAWVVAFQPLIDRVLLVLAGFSLFMLSRRMLSKVVRN